MIKENINTDFVIDYKVSDHYSMPEAHIHDAFEIYFSMTDGTKYFVNDKLYILKIGDLITMKANDLHKAIAPDNNPYKRYVIQFKPSYIEDLSTPDINLLECFFNRSGGQNGGFIHLNPSQQSDFIALVDRALRIVKEYNYSHTIYNKILLGEILIHLNEYYKSNKSFVAFRNDDNYKLIEPLIVYIQSNLNSTLTLSTLSSLFHLSIPSMSYYFKNVTGFTINDYIINKRIIKAKVLLLQNRTVTSVCESVGFNNYSHFIRTFTKIVGISPKQYALKNIVEK